MTSAEISTAELWNHTVNRLREHFATKNIPEKLKEPSYNQALAEHICSLMYHLCYKDMKLYDQAITDFIDYSVEFLKLQLELEKTGSYLFSSYKEAHDNVYQNKEVMEKRYLNGLLLSQALWINHHTILNYFVQEFCRQATETGNVMEVPVGSGIFISEFTIRNTKWTAEAYDISPSSVAFAKKILQLKIPNNTITLIQKNIFDLSSENKYDAIICGELLEHLEDPEQLLRKLKSMLHPNGRLFLTTAIWAAAIDHIYLFKSAQEVRTMLQRYFKIEKELVLTVFSGKSPEEEKTPINYACILTPKL
ncbi:MAG: class I SAM-dependent methyltransferase [Nanoarchaeota archaeon]|nr:class I SAM-dependent methyltransferase [Nanoarchaeota archaeon]